MRILLSIHHHLSYNSGASGSVLRMGDQYRAMGHCVLFYSYDNLPSFLSNSLKEILYPFFLAAHLVSLVIRKKIDIIDASTGDCWIWAIISPFLFSKRPLLVTRSHGLEHMVHAMLRKEAKQNRVTLRWFYHLYRGSIRLWVCSLCLKKSDLNFMLNTQESNYSKSKLKIQPEKNILISHGIDDVFLNLPFTPLDNSASRVIRVVQIGSFIQRKGIGFSIPALSKILESHRSVEVYFLGTGCERERVLERFNSDFHDRIKVASSFKHENLPEHLKDCHIKILPSLSEGFGLTLLEAMACGLAPVASAIEGPLELLQQNINGILVSPGSSEELTEALEKLISDHKFLEKIRCQAYKSAQNYSWKKSAQQQFSHYCNALQNKLR
ncbi:Glycosyl transferase [Chitinispirillum alkaliphilum]|nr:Glycosyl transferase [Chitinispirillum alkaliphilum]